MRREKHSSLMKIASDATRDLREESLLGVIGHHSAYMKDTSGMFQRFALVVRVDRVTYEYCSL